MYMENIKLMGFTSTIDSVGETLDKIDSIKKDGEGGDIKRISLNRDEFDSGLLEGLLEKFVSDVKMLMQWVEVVKCLY